MRMHGTTQGAKPEATIDLTQLGAGFAEPGTGAQQTFRQSLDALAHPGTLITLDQASGEPAFLAPAAAALALALLDQDTTLWLAPALLKAGPYLRFHTGCRLTRDPASADFAIAAVPDQLPPLHAFRNGSDEFPEHSSTLIIQTAALDTAHGWTLSGPGIRSTARLLAEGCGAPFAAEWQANHALFPRGVDIVFACGQRICGLPRTTRIGD